MALVPVFLGEAHFNAQTYTLKLSHTPERRELNSSVRLTAASIETAKEVKIFALKPLPDRSLTEKPSLLCGQPLIALRLGGWAACSTSHQHHGLLPGLRLHRVAHPGGANSPWRDLSFLAASLFRRLRAFIKSLLMSELLGGDGWPGGLYLDKAVLISQDIVAEDPHCVFARQLREGLVLEDVRLHLSPAPRLDGAPSPAFTLKAGEVVALADGAGKTTLRGNF